MAIGAAMSLGTAALQAVDQQQAHRIQKAPRKAQQQREQKPSTYRRINRAARGKRYTATVRQHQRHTAKAKNIRRAKASA